MRIGLKRLNTGHKVAIAAAGSLVVWLVVPWEQISYSLIEFIMAGAVPGTTIVLSPDVVIGAVVFAVASTAIIICMVGIGRFFMSFPSTEVIKPTKDTLKSPSRAAESSPAASTAKTTALTKIMAKTIKRLPPQAFGQRSSRVILFVYGLWWRYVEFTHQLMVKTSRQLSRRSRQLQRLVKPLLRQLYKYLLAASRFIYQHGAQAQSQVSQLVRRISQWSLPYLWQFDNFLNSQVAAMKNWWHHHINQHEVAKIIATIAREYKHTLRRIDRSTLHHYAKKQFNKLKKLL